MILNGRRSRTAAILCFFSALLFFVFHGVEAHAFTGPLSYKNQFPLFSHLSAPSVESARPSETSVSLGLSYSSIYMVRSSPLWSVSLDLEAAELDLKLRKNFNDSLELGFEVPVVSYNSGVLDGPLESYHSAFGFSDYGRSARPANDFLYILQKEGRTVVAGQSGRAGLGDIGLSVKKTLLEGEPALSVRVSVDLPTGDAKKGYGNGSAGASVAVLADKTVFEAARIYLNLGLCFPGDLKGYETVGLNEFFFAAVAAEAAVFKDTDLIAQVLYQRSPYPRTGIAEIDRNSVILSLGARYSSGDDSFELALTEDPSTSGAPDFSVSAAYKWNFR